MSQVRVLSPRLHMEDIMEKKDNLPEIVAVIATIMFLMFAFILTSPHRGVQGLESGNIERAIREQQYK